MLAVTRLVGGVVPYPETIIVNGGGDIQPPSHFLVCAAEEHRVFVTVKHEDTHSRLGLAGEDRE